MAANAVSFIKALRLPKVDVLGFSIGALMAQEMFNETPSGFRRPNEGS